MGPDANVQEKGAPGTPEAMSLCQVAPRMAKGGARFLKAPGPAKRWPGSPPGRSPRTHPVPGRRRRPLPPGSGPSACSSCCQAPTSPGTPGSPPARPAAPWTWLRRGRPGLRGGPGVGRGRSRGRRQRPGSGTPGERRGRRGATARGAAAPPGLPASPAPQISGPAKAPPLPNVTLRGCRASKRSAAAAPGLQPAHAHPVVLRRRVGLGSPASPGARRG